MRAIGVGEAVLIRNPHAIRPWQHVLEPLAGYLALAERLFTDGASFAEGWNFGPSDADARPVQWIVERLCSAWGDGAAWKLDARPQPHEASYLKLDCSKAAARLGWRPKWSLERSLERIVAWHRAQRAGADVRAATLAQIEEYVQD
jgi:CDP-glucose 4,6-dehydratase